LSSLKIEDELLPSLAKAPIAMIPCHGIELEDEAPKGRWHRLVGSWSRRRDEYFPWHRRLWRGWYTPKNVRGLLKPNSMIDAPI
jgi:hypothetical protein